MSTRGIPRASMAATSGRHVMVLVYLNVRIRLSILHILWQDVSCNMCSRKSTYRHCAHGSHRQQWLELCANAQHMQSKRQEHTEARARTEQSFHRSSHPNADFRHPWICRGACKHPAPSNTGTRLHGSREARPSGGIFP